MSASADYLPNANFAQPLVDSKISRLTYCKATTAFSRYRKLNFYEIYLAVRQGKSPIGSPSFLLTLRFFLCIEKIREALSYNLLLDYSLFLTSK